MRFIETFSQVLDDPWSNVFALFAVVDTNDRFLRKITIGQSPTEKNHIREVT